MTENRTALGATVILIVIIAVVFWAGALSNWSWEPVIVVTALVAAIALLFLLATKNSGQ